MGLISSPGAFPNSVNSRPSVGFFYSLEIGGKEVGYFSSIKGGDIEIAVIEHDIVYETGESTTLFIPGPTSFSAITLKQGVTVDNLELWNWLNEASSGNINRARRNGSITAYGEAPPGSKQKHTYTGRYLIDPSVVIQRRVAQWDFEGAWPKKISGFDLSADSTSVFVVDLTMVVEFIWRVKL